ncbi:MAG TPA: hypothetical protein VF331_09290 [Polyangiales bacterium]
MKAQAHWLSWLLMAALCAAAGRARADDSAAELSALVYPKAASGVRMHHETAAHRALACTACHATATTSTRAVDDLSPKEAVCVGCHAEPTDRSRGALAGCSFCHRGFDPAQPQFVAAGRSATPRIRFSHQGHVGVDGPCASCHASSPSGEPSLPSMSQCLACHAGRRALACTACHLATPGGLVETRFPEGKLVPRSGFLGMAHGGDFLVRHRWLAADEGNACASCHVEKDCSDCHAGDRRPARIHANDYLSLHAQDSRRMQTRCQSCHTTQSFCLPCHARLGISSVAAPDLLSPKRFHPPSSLWTRGPVQHAREAQRSLGSCVSCHAERDCVQCHGGKGIGAGLSPHPPGFAADCARRLAQNTRPCAMCHGSIEALRQRCR